MLCLPNLCRSKWKDNSPTCRLCNQNFIVIFHRRHHCRVCLKSVCGNCSALVKTKHQNDWVCRECTESTKRSQTSLSGYDSDEFHDCNDFDDEEHKTAEYKESSCWMRITRSISCSDDEEVERDTQDGHGQTVKGVSSPLDEYKRIISESEPTQSDIPISSPLDTLVSQRALPPAEYRFPCGDYIVPDCTVAYRIVKILGKVSISGSIVNVDVRTSAGVTIVGKRQFTFDDSSNEIILGDNRFGSMRRTEVKVTYDCQSDSLLVNAEWKGAWFGVNICVPLEVKLGRADGDGVNTEKHFA